MSDFAATVSNVTNIVIWLLVGPAFALLLFHLAERRWGNGPTWAWLGMFFNVFALLAYLLLAGYESNAHHSSGVLETQRVRKLMDAANGLRSQQRSVVDPAAADSDPYIEELLSAHRPADALVYARERLHAAFSTGDHSREELYSRYVADIVTRDAELHARLEELKRDAA